MKHCLKRSELLLIHCHIALTLEKSGFNKQMLRGFKVFIKFFQVDNLELYEIGRSPIIKITDGYVKSGWVRLLIYSNPT